MDNSALVAVQQISAAVQAIITREGIACGLSRVDPNLFPDANRQNINISSVLYKIS